MARVLSEIATKAASKNFVMLDNIYVKDALFFTGVSADTDLVSAGYIWCSMYFYDTTKGVKENIDVLNCIELEQGDTVTTLVKIAQDKGFSASAAKPLNITCHKTKVPLRYRKYSNESSASSNADELF